MLSLVGEGEKSVSCRFKSADVLKILAFSALFGLARAVFYALKLNDSLVPEMQVFFRASILCTAFLFFLIVLTQQMLIRQPEMGIVSSPMKHFLSYPGNTFSFCFCLYIPLHC
jgi:hypothetical protein